MADLIAELKKDVDEINQLIARKNRLEGKKEQLFSNLKTNFKVDTVEAAEELLKKLQGGDKKCEEKLSTIVAVMDSIISSANVGGN